MEEMITRKIMQEFYAFKDAQVEARILRGYRGILYFWMEVDDTDGIIRIVGFKASEDRPPRGSLGVEAVNMATVQSPGCA